MHRAEFDTPEADRFAADSDATFSEAFPGYLHLFSR